MRLTVGFLVNEVRKSKKEYYMADKDEELMDWAQRHGERWGREYINTQPTNDPFEQSGPVGELMRQYEGGTINPPIPAKPTTFAESSVGRGASYVYREAVKPYVDAYQEYIGQPFVENIVKPIYEGIRQDIGRIGVDLPISTPSPTAISTSRFQTQTADQGWKRPGTSAVFPTDEGTGNEPIIPGRRYLPGTEGYIDLPSDWDPNREQKVGERLADQSTARMRSEVEAANPERSRSYYGAHPEELEMQRIQEILNPGMTNAEKSQNFRDRMRLESSFASPAEKAVLSAKLDQQEKNRGAREVAATTATTHYITGRQTAQTASVERQRKQVQDEQENRFKMFELGLQEAKSGSEIAERTQRMRESAGKYPGELAKTNEEIRRMKTQQVLDASKEDRQSNSDTLWAAQEKFKSNPMNPVYEKEYNDLVDTVHAYGTDKANYLRINPNLHFPPKMPRPGQSFPLDNTGDLFMVTPRGIIRTYKAPRPNQS